jgi:hypothetical protein
MTFLEKQFGLLEEQAGTWKSQHDEAMRCHHVEDLVAFLRTFLRCLRHRSDQWGQSVGAEFSWEDSEFFCAWYRRWLELAGNLLGVVAELEKGGFQVEGAGRLRVARRDVSLMALDTDRVRASIASLENGEGVPMGQVLNDLRDNLQS